MDKVVDLQKRIDHKRHKRQLEQHRGKIEALQKLIQCSSCHFKCAMCGHHITNEGSSDNQHSPPFEYTFCESCRLEFEDFLSISGGEKQSEVFWHNKDWINMWSAWLNYRQAMRGFTDSPEFKLMIRELNTQT